MLDLPQMLAWRLSRVASNLQGGLAPPRNQRCSSRLEPACSDGCLNGLAMLLSKKALLSRKAVADKVAHWVDKQAVASGTEMASASASIDPGRSPKLPQVQPMDEDDSPRPAALRRFNSLSQRYKALTVYLPSPNHRCGQEDSPLACDGGQPRAPTSFEMDMQDADPTPTCAGQSQPQRGSSLELRFAALASAELYAFAHRIVVAT